MPGPTKPAALAAAALLLAGPPAAAEGPALDGRIPEANPFRLSIPRSEYALVAKTEEATPAPPARKAAPARLAPLIDQHSRSRGIDPALVHAVIRAESAYRPEAVSPKGAIGLMQVMPGTGRRFGVHDLAAPENNLKAGTAYLKHLLDRYGNVPLALAAYNAGEGAVDRHGQAIPPYPETRAYVSSILREYWTSTVPGAPLRSTYLEGARLEGLDLSPYRLSRP